MSEKSSDLSGGLYEQKTWDLYAPIYKRAMKADQKIYDFMYERIPEMVKDKDILEFATDYSDGMIAEAKKGVYPENLRFEVADAMALPYEENTFDAVLIANALHIVPDPEKVLSENDRVLKPGGLLIAPNFVEHNGTFISRVWSRILRIAGVRFEHQWSAQEYLELLKNNGWQVTFSKEMAARIVLTYAECKRGNDYIKKTGNHDAEQHFSADNGQSVAAKCGMELVEERPFFGAARKQLKRKLKLYTRIAMKVVDEGGRRGFLIHLRG